MSYLDLSHLLTPGKEEYQLDLETHQVDEMYPQYHRRPDDWYIFQVIHMHGHVGTHIESPYHHRRDGDDISRIPLDKLIGAAVKLDLTHKKPGEVISKEELMAASLSYALKDKIVLLHTGRDKFYHDVKLGHERPYPSADAVSWLVQQGISCLGVDATGIEVKGLDYQPNHEILFSANIPLVENVTNLEQLRKNEFHVVILPLNIKGMESCPVRVVAFEDDEA